MGEGQCIMMDLTETRRFLVADRAGTL